MTTQPATINKLLRFVLVRDEDLTGVSGSGVVAEGIVFTCGQVVIHWLRQPFSMGLYQSLEDVIFIHGHGGRTKLQFIDQGETT
jgi:hypothetical protein